MKNPPLTGVYCLIINLKEKSGIQIGRKRKIVFQEGCYVYVGSALNSLTARIKRHLSDEKKLHWHIDYLLKNSDSEIVDVIFTLTTERLECKVAQIISEKVFGISGFGSSDCKCPSHLFYFEDCDKAIDACQNAFIVLKQEQKVLKDLKN
jgi:Uri superfamily endonuclease